MSEPGADELLEVEVPVGGRVLVVSDLHLTGEATVASVAATSEIAQTIDAWTGPGVLVFNGSCIELLRSGPDLRPALNAHRRLAATVLAFAGGPGRRVIYLPGARDGRAAWDPAIQTSLLKLLGAEMALALELQILTGAGRRTVRVEPGHRLDPLTCPGDPRNPADSPLGQHLICEVLPALGESGAAPAAAPGSGRGREAAWLSGLDTLDDPGAFPRFLASRLTYRRLGRHAWWLLLPLLAAVLLRLPLAVMRRAHSHVALASRIGVYLVLATIVELLVIASVVAVVIRGTWRALAGVALSRSSGPGDANAAARGLARDLVTAGHAGLITGHTRHPELTHLGTGFYANTGCGCEVVSETPARLDSIGMPALFMAHRQVAWVELEAGNELHVRLLHARRDLPGATIIERLLTRRDPESRPPNDPAPNVAAGRSGADTHPEVVATFPQGGSWPAAVDVSHRQRRIRRWAAGLVALAGLLSLTSAFSAPMGARLTDVLQLVPLVVPQAANALVAVAGLGLLLLARSVRRGQRRAWLICQGLLIGSAVLHMVKGVDIEEALIAAAVAGFLFVHRDVFKAGVDRTSTRRGLETLAGGAVAAVVTGTIGVEIGTMLAGSRNHQRLPLLQAFRAASERLVGLNTVSLPERLDDFVAPAMLTVAIGIVLAAGYLFSRPVAARRATVAVHPWTGSRAPMAGPLSGDDGLARARGVVRRHGAGTLDYFALRSDKQWFFWGDSLVAYGVYGGVCLVSPDPIGPIAERQETWREFRRFADEQGWALAVLGAGEQWLPVYRSSGMHDLYLGDEGVVNCSRFSLDGGRYKGLRQAVNRIAKYGYTITFHDPAMIDPELRAQLASVMTKSRRGDVERGFSMTLGRVFDPSDDGLLLAVVWSPPGRPAGAGGEGGAGGSEPVAAQIRTSEPVVAQTGTSEPVTAPTGTSEPVAFCQYVPAPGIAGFSLDLMRRDDGDHPNGLLDFVIVETIWYLKSHEYRGLGLNFATMRAVLAGEAGEGMSQRIQAWLLRRMSDSMQIESLWRFNAKYDPDWQPRYALYDSPENGLPTAIAVARAESFWELPVIGRFLVPNGAVVEAPTALPVPDKADNPASG